MKAVVLHCAPGAQFHFGRIAADPDASLDSTSDIPHSDTLFSSLVVVTDKAFPTQTRKLLAAFDSGQIRLSSGFYCLHRLSREGSHEEAFVWFLPKPVHHDLVRLEGLDRKMVSRVQFVSAGVWRAGWGPKEWCERAVFLQGQKFVALPDELAALGISPEKAQKVRLYGHATLPKVSVHKPTRENALFAQTNLQMGDNRYLDRDLRVHFYFLLENDLPADQAALLESALQLLADEGIGGERSTGCGRIEAITQQNFDLDLPPTDQLCTVSLVNPADADDLQRLTHYRITTRGGRRTLHDGKLRRVKMVAEGAVAAAGLTGRTVDISANQDKSYLRYGKALCLPLPALTQTS